MTARIPLARSAAIRILTFIQNCAHFTHQDILTFTGFMTDDEVREHVWRCFGAVSPADKARVLELARDVLIPAQTRPTVATLASIAGRELKFGDLGGCPISPAT